MIIFTNNITSIKSFYKTEAIFPKYFIERNYKRKVGYKFGIIPVYEIVEEAVLASGWSSASYHCELKDFESDFFYFENDILYDYPHCLIATNDGKKKEKYFRTAEELNAFVEDLASKAPHIKL